MKTKLNIESLYFTKEEWTALEDFETGIETICKSLECEACPFKNHILCEVRNLTGTLYDDFHVVFVEEPVAPEEES